MNDIPAQIVENVFPEERSRFYAFFRGQKRNLRMWLLLTILLFLIPVFLYLPTVIRYVITYPQTTFNWIIFSWIIVIVVLPFIWPEKPGDFFSENFRKGLNPRIWEYEGLWKIELDENGKTVLSITNSDKGGLVLPCLSWVDYELKFETRIINQCTAWIIRASNLSNYVMFQLRKELLRPHYRISGVWTTEEFEHKLNIRESEWYPVRTLVRGTWVTIYITVEGKEQLVYQKQLPLAKQAFINVQLADSENPDKQESYRQLVDFSPRTGSFGFRLHGDEVAQFRNINAYRLR